MEKVDSLMDEKWNIFGFIICSIYLIFSESEHIFIHLSFQSFSELFFFAHFTIALFFLSSLVRILYIFWI